MLTFVNNFHPSLKFFWPISDEQLAFLDLILKPTIDFLITSIHYKPADTHSYLNCASSDPTHCKEAIPNSQFLGLRCICTDESDFEGKTPWLTAGDF